MNPERMLGSVGAGDWEHALNYWPGDLMENLL